MSVFSVNLRQVLYILELFGTFTCTWPVEPNASHRKILSRNVQWAFAMLNVIFLMTSFAFAIYHFRNDVTTLLKTACEMMTLLEVFLDLLLCKMKNRKLQVLIGKVKRFSEEASEQENRVMQGYIDRYKRFFSVTAMGYIVTAISFNFVPLFSEQELPADGLLPFSTKPLAVHCIVYASQVYCILLTAFCICVDFTIAVLFSFPAAKLDLLGMRLRQVNDCDMLVSCVKQHQRIIGFVKDTKAAVEALLFKTNATMGSAVICGAFPLIYSQSVAIMSQFLPLVVSGCAHLFVISWPADDLKESVSQPITYHDHDATRRLIVSSGVRSNIVPSLILIPRFNDFYLLIARKFSLSEFTFRGKDQRYSVAGRAAKNGKHSGNYDAGKSENVAHYDGSPASGSHVGVLLNLSDHSVVLLHDGENHDRIVIIPAEVKLAINSLRWITNLHVARLLPNDMWKRVGPQGAITLTKLSVALACNWPPSPFASESQLFVYNVLWCASFLSSISLFVPLVVAIYEFRKDLIVVGKSACLAAGVSQVAIKMVMCRVQLKNFQMLYFEMESFCKNATAEERMVLQRYVDRYKYIHGTYVLWCFLITGFVIASPLYLPQSFPTHAVYPFSVEHPLLKLFVFFHQTLVGIQASSGLAIDTQIAMLLRYAAARLELLGSQLRNAKSAHEFNACIEKHDKLLRYTRKIRRTVKLLILTTISTTIVAVIFGSLNLITKQPLRLKVLYAILALSASVELFMYAWPADNLTHVSSRIATDAYHTDWYERDIGIQKMILYVILRSQKLEAIRISGIVPNVSLSYYAQYLYASFSYFTALRIMVESSVPNETL